MTLLSKIDIKGGGQLPSYATQASVFVRGTDAYEQTRLGKELTIETEDGKTISGNLTNKRVGALVELMPEFGGFNLHTFGLPYSPVSLIQSIGDGQGEDPVDVTKLYTVLTVQVQPTQAIPTTVNPSA